MKTSFPRAGQMRLPAALLILSSFFLTPSFAQVTLPPSGDNQKSVVTQYIGALAHVTITYSSPNVTAPNGEDRTGKIWGQLVPYGLVQQGFGLNNPSPWRAGANENTTIEFSHDVSFQGKPVKAGKYGFFVIVQESGPWTIILSENSTAWGSYFYRPEEDVLRVEATPGPAEFHEYLTFEFTDREADRCTAALAWEKIRLPFTVEVPNAKDLYVENLRRELQNSPGFSYRSYVQAAQYCVNNDVNLEEALTWAETAVSMPFIGQKNFTTLQTKALVLYKLDRESEADAIMDEAIRDPTADVNAIHQYGRQLITQGKKEKALEVMEYNYDRFQGAWPTNVSMARALAANGRYDEALPYAEKALAQAPDDLNRNNLQQAIDRLKNKQDIN